MKWLIFVNTIAVVTSLAITRSLNPDVKTNSVFCKVQAINIKQHAEVNGHTLSSPPTVDLAATRGQWVSSYKYNGFEWDHPGHWVNLYHILIFIQQFLTSN